jgi:hypothetical protein
LVWKQGGNRVDSTARMKMATKIKLK